MLLEMGTKTKKEDKMSQKKSSSLVASKNKNEDADFLPLEGGPARKLSKVDEPVTDNATVLYIGRIPHGFYEEQMDAFFKQFGKIKRLKIARNKKTGKSKHYGFIEFETPQVAKIVADCMHNYLLFEHMLQVHLIPPERVHPKLWSRMNPKIKPLNRILIARRRHNKERTVEQHKRLIQGIVKRDKKRRKRIEAAGIVYEYPEVVVPVQPTPKKIKFDDEDE